MTTTSFGLKAMEQTAPQRHLKIAHVVAAHRRDDTRVFRKECVSLAEAGHDVALLVADGQGDARSRGVQIIDIGLPRTPWDRYLGAPMRSALTAHRLKPSAIHVHEPWFLPFALVLALMGHRVVYDAHEDTRQQVLNWRFAWPINRAASLVFAALETLGGLMFRQIVTATPHIARHFPRHKTIVVQNFPIADELAGVAPTPYSTRPPHVAYVGGIAAIRGARQILDALVLSTTTDLRAEMAGSFSPPSLKDEAEQHEGWAKVDFHGWLDRAGLAELLARCRVGLVLFLPRPNHLESQPNKLFEYMAAGLPVIASNFLVWRQFVETAECGLTVDPLSPTAIAEAIDWLMAHEAEAEAMGIRGAAAVRDLYNWNKEAETLVAFYSTLRP